MLIALPHGAFKEETLGGWWVGGGMMANTNTALAFNSFEIEFCQLQWLLACQLAVAVGIS